MQEFFVEKESVTLDSCPIHAVLQSHSMKKHVISPHIHSAIEFLIVKEGSYDICVDEQRFCAHPGDMVLLRSNTIHHSYSTSENSSYYVIKVRPSLLAELSDGKADGGYLLFFTLDTDRKCFWTAHELEDTPLGIAVKRCVREFEENFFAKSIALTVAMSTILLEILREGGVSENKNEVSSEAVTRRIYDVLLYINKNYNQPITALECAQLAGMSYSYFSRTFAKTVGKSFKEYLNVTRVNHAQKALMSKDMTVTETAAHCGFDNVSYFISVYKRIRGVTPRAEKSTVK